MGKLPGRALPWPHTRHSTDGNADPAAGCSAPPKAPGGARAWPGGRMLQGTGPPGPPNKVRACRSRTRVAVPAAGCHCVEGPWVPLGRAGGISHPLASPQPARPGGKGQLVLNDGSVSSQLLAGFGRAAFLSLPKCPCASVSPLSKGHRGQGGPRALWCHQPLPA